jgi:hypothetical protein
MENANVSGNHNLPTKTRMAELEAAKFIWDEYKYRHEHCWKLIFQITVAVIVVSIVPYTQDTIGRVLDNRIIALPALGILLALFGSIRLNRELDLLGLLKKHHREFLLAEYGFDYKREGFLHHKLGGFYVHVAFTC